MDFWEANMNNVAEALDELKKGNIIIVADESTRENEGDLIMAAEFATAEKINFIAKYARGLICMPIDCETANKLDLKPMVENNTDNHETAFTVSIDFNKTTTGISAYERALTMKKATEDNSTGKMFRRPGHVFPLIAKEGGLKVRKGHTEATVELMKLAGLKPVGICCEIMNDDGSMARKKDLEIFSKKHSMVYITTEDIEKYILQHSYNTIKEISTVLPTKYGDFNISVYKNKRNNRDEIVLSVGDVNSNEPVPVRIHSECLTGEIFGSCRCDCGTQLEEALKYIQNKKRGILIYLKQEGRDIGIVNKLKAYKLQYEGLDTVDANLALGLPEDARKYDVAVDILKIMGVKNVELITNNPDKIKALKENGIDVTKRIPIEVSHSYLANKYLYTKKTKMGHIIEEKFK